MLNFIDENRDKFNTISDIIEYIKYMKFNIKEYLEYIFGAFIIGLCIDETEDLLLINSKKLLEHIDYQNKYYYIINNSPSLIIDKHSKIILIELFNNININNESLKKYDWNNTYVSYIYPGINLVLFFYKSKWEVAWENSLDIYGNIEGYGNLGDIGKNLFEKINLSNLNKNYYYHILYQNNKNKNYIENCLLNNLTEEYILVSTYEIETFNQINNEVENLNKIQQLHFSCLDELVIKLDFLSYDNKINKNLTYAGFNIKVLENNRYVDNYYFYTEIYSHIKKQIIGGINIYKMYLELYQKNYLNEILPYISKYSNEIIHRLNVSMKTLSREILNIYHTTRKKKHQELYKLLPELYKKILYGLHGLYINSRRKEIVNRIQIEYDESKSITVHDVYYFIKELTPYQLIELFKERTELLKNPNFENIMNHDCIYTLTQAKLMEKDNNEIFF